MTPRATSKRRPGKSKLPSIAFVGAGALATSLARSLAAHGYTIREFVLRSPLKPGAAVKSLARELNAELHSFQNCALDADLLWIAVPDDAIADCTAQLAAGRNLHGKIVLHSSGALSSEVLATAQAAGALTASLHPMMSFSCGNRNPDLRGVSFAIEGQAAATRAARLMVKRLGGHALDVLPEQKALYHAFGAMIAPLLVSQLQAAQNMALRAGLDTKSARAAMKPIVEKVVAAFLQGGAQHAFSGPFQRGDVNTVARHLEALRGANEETAYRALAQYAVENIPVENQEKLRKLLQTKS